MAVALESGRQLPLKFRPGANITIQPPSEIPGNVCVDVKTLRFIHNSTATYPSLE